MVLNDNIIDIIERKRPSVTGNGIDSLKILIDKYNKQQVKDKHHKVKNIDNKLEGQFGNIIENGKKIYLSDTINYHNGSPLDRIDIKSVPIEKIAMFKRINNILSMNLSGIDYMSSDITKRGDNGYIIEVNERPDIKIHDKVLPSKVDDFIRNIFPK